jgi:hypothetical protein
MHHPLQAIRVGRRRRAFLPLLALTALLGAVLGWVDRPLRTRAAPGGIVSFEVAGDAASARRMVDSWAGAGHAWAAFSLGIDYLFLVVYSTTLALGCLWAAGVLATLSPGLGALGVPLAWGQWAAAALDAIENAALTVVLLGDAGDPWPAVAWWSAVPKFVLLTAGLLYVLAAAGVRLARGPTPP